MKKLIALATACTFAAMGTGPLLAQEKAKPAAAPKAAVKDDRQAKVHVENEKVRVTDTTYKPGASSGMQERGPRVVRALSDGTLEKTFPDGKKETIEWKTGQVKYLPKETYSQKNVGKTDVVLYVINLK
jgi:hypothetical protein